MHLVKFKHAIELWWTLKSPRLGKISASNQNLSRKVWRSLTIWAWQNLQLLTSSWSGWRALVQILVDVLILRHVDLKWSEGSGRSAFMGGVSPVLYWLGVPARPVKISAGVQIHAAAQIFTISCENSKICMYMITVAVQIQLPTHSLRTGGRPRFWARLPKTVYNPLGGGGVRRGGGNGSAGRLLLLSHLKGGGSKKGGGEGKREGGVNTSLYYMQPYAHSFHSNSLFFLSPFCCRLQCKRIFFF